MSWVTQADIRAQGDLGRLRATQCDAAQRQPGGVGVPSPPRLVSHRDESRALLDSGGPAVGPFVFVLCGSCLLAPASLWRTFADVLCALFQAPGHARVADYSPVWPLRCEAQGVLRWPRETQGVLR